MKANKKQLLNSLEKMMDKYPDWRIGQLVANVSFWAKGPKVESVWDLEDEEFIKTVQEHLEKKLS